jgi:hypothetical protein
MEGETKGGEKIRRVEGEAEEWSEKQKVEEWQKGEERR